MPESLSHRTQPPTRQEALYRANLLVQAGPWCPASCTSSPYPGPKAPAAAAPSHAGTSTDMLPTAVAKVAAVEPSRLCLRIAQPRIAVASTRVELAGLTGESLDVGSEEFDAALSTWVLCTIPDVGAALSEIRRALKPGGRLHFVEHGHAPDEQVARWQTRVEPLWKCVAGGCHLTRRITDLIEQAGFRSEALETYYNKGEPKMFGYTYEGQATKT